MVESWQQGGSVLSGWLLQWHSLLPKSIHFNPGLQRLEQLLHERLQLQSKQQGIALPADYETMLDHLRLIFRRYAFQPAAVCAYLVIVAIDLYRVRSDLMQRLFFLHDKDVEVDLPL